MRIETRAYQPGDLAALAQRGARESAGVDEARLLSMRSWTLILDGAPAAIAALVPNWTGYVSLSAIIGPLPLRAWPAIRSICRDVLEGLQDRSGEYRRIDCTIRAGEAGHWRFAQSLGFRPEGYLQAYGPSGDDFIMAARVRRDVESPT